MHVYNDDFGTLANLAAFKLTGDNQYRNAAERFLKRMAAIQRNGGGFGPTNSSVPSAAGSILIEALAARAINLDFISDQTISKAVDYLLSIQIRNEKDFANGAFIDNDTESIARTGAYSIMALLRYAGAADNFYFLSQ